MKNRFLIVLSLFIMASSLMIISFQPINSKNTNIISVDVISPSPSISPTDIPWQTYRHEKFGFEFQFPYRNSFFPEVSVEQTKLSYDAIIKNYNSPKHPKLQKCTPGGKCLIYEDITKETYHKIGGVNITRFTYTGMESEITELYFSYQNKNYLVNLGLFMEDDETVNKIISTFVFFDPTKINKCTTDNDCQKNEFCDYSTPGGLGPNGPVKGTPSGSQKCIQKCVSGNDCQNKSCQQYQITTEDIVFTKLGCRP